MFDRRSLLKLLAAIPLVERAAQQPLRGSSGRVLVGDDVPIAEVVHWTFATCSSADDDPHVCEDVR